MAEGKGVTKKRPRKDELLLLGQLGQPLTNLATLDNPTPIWDFEHPLVPPADHIVERPLPAKLAERGTEQVSQF